VGSVFLLAALASAAPLQAQVATGTMRGRATDRASEQPLLGALVSIADGPSTLSDRDGRQVLVRAEAGAHTVNVSTFGYANHSSWWTAFYPLPVPGFWRTRISNGNPAIENR
jgi:hypothetical protein